MKPILKWVGGKTQIIDLIISEFPKNIHDYHEIFLGGGSVLFALLEQIKEKKIILTGKIYAYDLNEGLINVYKNIQDNHEILYENLQKLITDFNSIDVRSTDVRSTDVRSIPNSGNENTNTKILTLADARRSKSNYYYYIRNVFNDSSNFSNPLYSAMFIFLNKTCFRGMFRVGPNGFNVPYGNYSNPEIINKEHLDSINLLIKDVKFECCDFKKSLENVGTESTESTGNNFVYLDPPYVPENDTSFVGYTLNGFDKNRHKELFDILLENKFKFMMSNSDMKILKELFNKCSILTVNCKRSINSKKPGSRTNELIIKN